MHREISPKVTAIIIATAVLIAVAVIYQVLFKPAQPPTVQPRPWSPSYGGAPAGTPARR